MRSPSSRVLKNTVDYYAGTVVADTEGGPLFTYPGFPTRQRISCSVQAGPVNEFVDAQGRITQEREYKIILAQSLNPNARDMFIYTDTLGNTHTLFAHVERDEAGRGSTYVVRAIEKL